MAKLISFEDDHYSHTPQLDARCEFTVDGEVHTGVIVGVSFSRSYGHAISDIDGRKYEFDAGEEGFRVL